MKLIVAVDKNWAIGYNNQLLISIPADKKFFRTTTTGKTIIMGRKTLESFPNGLPLANRNNIVITSNSHYDGHGAIVVHSIEEAVKKARELSAEDDIYVVGGGKIYNAMYEMCDTAYVTMIDYAYVADTYFPKLTKENGWELVEESDEQACFDITYTFCTFKKNERQ